jgi:hypothetical protein
MELNADRLSWRRLLLLASGPKALSIPAILLGFVLSVVIHFAPNGNTIQGDFWVRFIVAAIGYLPALFFIALGVLVSRKLENTSVAIVVVLLGYFLGAAARGVLFSIVFFQLDMSSELNIGFRIFSSAIPFGLSIVVAAISIGALSESRSRIKVLATKQSELFESLNHLRASQRNIDEKITNETQAWIEAELSHLNKRPNAEILSELKTLVIEYVRPLSHQLASEVPTWKPAPVKEVNPNWKLALRNVTPQLAMRPIPISIATTLSGTPSMFFLFGPEKAVGMLSIALVCLFTFTYALRELMGLFRRSFSVWVNIIVCTVLFYTISIPTGFLVDLYAQDPSHANFSFQASLTFIPALGWLLLLGSAASAQEKEIENNLRSTVGQLNWLRARINLINWFNQGESSRFLHGPVQSAIHRTIINYENAEAEESRVRVLGELKTQIDSAMVQPKPAVDLIRRSRDLQEFWSGVCEIQFDWDENVLETLREDWIAASVLWDVAIESCVNAIKHGQAKTVNVKVRFVEDRINIYVTNRGLPPSKVGSSGLGRKILESCAISWSLSNRKGITTLRASLPVELKQ